MVFAYVKRLWPSNNRLCWTEWNKTAKASEKSRESKEIIRSEQEKKKCKYFHMYVDLNDVNWGSLFMKQNLPLFLLFARISPRMTENSIYFRFLLLLLMLLLVTLPKHTHISQPLVQLWYWEKNKVEKNSELNKQMIRITKLNDVFEIIYEYWIEWIWQNMENWVLFIKCSSSCWAFFTWYTSILKQICDWQ